mmetsp:Transcript_95920/g.165316  ORF Transcript_95920/g.165316 Transcript_95920/m.165316 type:complete len:95 (-) Transcript_95920:82-366(-)
MLAVKSGTREDFLLLRSIHAGGAGWSSARFQCCGHPKSLPRVTSTFGQAGGVAIIRCRPWLAQRGQSLFKGVSACSTFPRTDLPPFKWSTTLDS